MIRPRTVVLNLAVFAAVLAAVELGSWTIVEAYEFMQRGRKDESGIERRPGPQLAMAANDPAAIYSDPEIQQDLARHAEQPGSAYRYESFVVYRNRPYRSPHVNIGDDGRRWNGPNAPPEDAAVWVFGSSAPWGATNADNETIPAMIEASLARGPAGERHAVANDSVVGYSSWQEVTNFALRLRDKPKPKVAIFFSGLNDYYLGWQNKTKACEALDRTGVDTYEALTDGWEARTRGRLVAWPVAADAMRAGFKNTLELSRLSDKFFKLREANADIATWKQNYRTARDAENEIAALCVLKASRTFVSNMMLAVRLAQDRGIVPVLIQQPLLFATRKKLIGPEIAETENPNYTQFVLTDAELDSLASVPSYRIDQRSLWDKALFLSLYSRQSEMLHAGAAQTGTTAISLEAVIDAIDNEAVFSSAAHFTFRGAHRLGKAIADRIKPLLDG
ncbi:MAG: hypothetical protein FJX62_19180 [Alphaproteobacteria bacterium]|nr:hypothetical protein [Alphaproteobacteria bacterium]